MDVLPAVSPITAFRSPAISFGRAQLADGNKAAGSPGGWQTVTYKHRGPVSWWELPVDMNGTMASAPKMQRESAVKAVRNRYRVFEHPKRNKVAKAMLRKHGSWHSNVLDPEPHLTFDFLDKGNSKINGTQHTHIADIREYDAEYAKILLSKLPVVPTNQLGQNQPPGGGQGSATVAAWFPRPVLDIGLETPHVFMYDDMNPLLQRTPIQAY